MQTPKYDLVQTGRGNFQAKTAISKRVTGGWSGEIPAERDSRLPRPPSRPAEMGCCRCPPTRGSGQGPPGAPCRAPPAGRGWCPHPWNCRQLPHPAPVWGDCAAGMGCCQGRLRLRKGPPAPMPVISSGGRAPPAGRVGEEDGDADAPPAFRPSMAATACMPQLQASEHCCELQDTKRT